MDSDVKSGVDIGFNFAFGASFLLGPAAPYVGGVVSMGHVLFDALAKVDPKAPDKPLPDNSLHKADLVELEKAIAKDVGEILKEDDLTNDFDEIKTKHGIILQNWNAAKVGISRENLKKYEEAGTVKNWLKVDDSYFSELVGLNSSIKNFITKCSHPDTEIKAMPAFVYAVWTYLLLGKVCLLWEMDDIRMSKADEVVKARETLKEYRSAHLGLARRDHITHKRIDPTAGPNVPDEIKAAKLTLANAIDDVHSSSYSAVVTEIQGYLPDHCIAHLRHLIKRIKETNEAYHDRLRKLENKELVVTEMPIPYAHTVTFSPVDKFKNAFVTSKSFGDVHNELIVNQYEPEMWELMVNNVQELGQYTKADIANLEEVLHFWEGVQLDTVHAMNDMHSTVDKSHPI